MRRLNWVGRALVGIHVLGAAITVSEVGKAERPTITRQAAIAAVVTSAAVVVGLKTVGTTRVG